MRRQVSIAVLSLLMGSAALAPSLTAQTTQPPRRRQPPAASAAGPRYDLKTVGTFQGALTALDTVASMSGMPGSGVHATLKTATETLPVQLGPVMYLTTQKTRLAKGDAVTVIGSRISFYTVPTILAASIVKGADTLKLRDANGFPLWRGMRMRAAR